MRTRWHALSAAAFATLALGGCADELTSPTPAAESLSPGLVCAEQLTTVIELSGMDLSPLPFDTLSGDPALALPIIRLYRVETIDYEAVADEPVVIDDATTLADVLWFDQTHMQFTVTEALGLQPGVYDLEVENADGQSARVAMAFTVTGRPSLAERSPDIVCAEQYDNQFTLHGDNFITVNGERPEVLLGDVPLTVDGMIDCYPLHGPVTAELCTGMEVILPQNGIAPGVHQLTMTNPDPTGCSTTEVFEIEVTPAPTNATLEPLLACTEQGARSFVLDGTGYLVLDDGEAEAMPTIMVGEYVATLDEITSCTDLAGPHGGRSCDQMTFTIAEAAGELGVNDVMVTNPETAQCRTLEDTQLELVPAPTVASVTPALICSDQLTYDLIIEGDGFVTVSDGDGVLVPAISFGADTTLMATRAEDCEDLAGPLGGQTCDTLILTVDPLTLDPGVYDITIENPEPAGCMTSEPVEIELIPPPTLASIEPVLACIDQSERTFTLTGTSFLLLGAEDAPEYPTITVGPWSTAASAGDGCTELTGPVEGRLCETLTLTIPAAEEIDPGVHQVSVTNPGDASCETTEEDVTLELVPAPVIEDVVPALACNDQLDNTIVITGQDFIVVPGEDGPIYPTIAVGDVIDRAVTSVDGCETLPGDLGAETCTTVTLAVAPLELESGVYDIAVTNPEPAGCVTAEGPQLEMILPPTLAAVDPLMTCLADGEQAFAISGTGFLALGAADDATLPTIMVGDQAITASTAETCTELTGPTEGRLCEALTLVVPNDPAVLAGVYDLSVTNPAPAACETIEEGIALEVVDAPTFTGVGPDLLCSASPSGASVVLDGTFRLLEDGAGGYVMPTVTLGGEAIAATAPTDDAAICSATDTLIPGFACTELHVDLGGVTLTSGVHAFTVTNPDPIACVAPDTFEIEVVGAPTVTELVPAGLCAEATATEVTLLGTDFLVLGAIDTPDERPVVTIGGGEATILDIPAGSCTALERGDGSLCTEIVLDLGPLYVDGAFGAFDEPIVVTNPALGDQDACVSPAEPPVAVVEAPAPELVAVVPVSTCDDDDVLTYDLTGNFIQNGATVSVEGAETGPITLFSASFAGVSPDADPDTVTLSFFEPLQADTYTVTLVNPDGCAAEDSAEFVVEAAPFLFNVDPPVVYSEITTRTTLYMSAGSGSTSAVEMIQEGVADPFTLELTPITDPENPGVVLLDIPGGTVDIPAGSYTLRLTETTTCDSEIAEAFVVEDELTVTVSLVDPPFGEVGTDTAIDITGEGFIDLPRVYLNPVAAGADDVATPLRGVSFTSSARMNAVVPPTNLGGDLLPAGEYDVIVVNPDGTIGVGSGAALDDALGIFRLSDVPPPVIDDISPPRVPVGYDGTLVVELSGTGFFSPEVTYFCVASDGTERDTIVVTEGELSSASETLIEVAPPTAFAGAIAEGDVCIVRVTNTAEGTYGDYSSLSVGSNSGNIFAINPGLAMDQPRRAVSAQAGRATNAARFVYAMGGDEGTDDTALDSIEAAALDRYGRMQSWFTLGSASWHRTADTDPALPFPITRASTARLGRFIYLVGGHDGATPLDTVLRAEVLSPLNAPTFDRLYVALNQADQGELSEGLAPGTYHYRIAALFADDDPYNADGESLASDPIIVRVPDLNPADDDIEDIFNGLQLTISWHHVDRAIGYRVYRTPTGDAGSGTEELQTDILLADALTPEELAALAPGDPLPLHLDDGTLATTPGITPLPLGSLGTWNIAALMPGASPARASSCAAIAADPCNTAIADPADFSAICADTVNPTAAHYLYVGGGLDADGTVRDTVLGLQLIDMGDGYHMPGTWVAGIDEVLPSERWECGANVVDAGLHSVVEPWESWVYFGAGRTQSGIQSGTDMLAVQVERGGTLTGAMSVGSASPTRVGYAHAAASDFLYVFGGERNGGFRDDGNEAEISGPPALENWNNLSGGVVLSYPRFLAGSTQESSFIFIVGGLVDAGCADTCATASNGVCEDGRPGSDSYTCEHGTDCADCGGAPFASPTVDLTNY